MKLTNLTTSFAVAAIGTLLTGVILVAENQWAVIGALLAAAALSIVLARLKIGMVLASVLNESSAWVALLIPLGGVIIGFALHEEDFVLMMLATVLIYGLACVGLTIQFGYAGVINFAGAAFFGIGGYTAALLGEWGIPSLLIIVAGGMVAAAIGCILILPVLRTKGHYAALITIAFGLLFRSFLEVNHTLGGPQGLKVEGASVAGHSLLDGIQLGSFQASFYLNYVLLALGVFTICFILARNLEKSWIGVNFDAVREDPIGASVFGVNVAYWRIMAFVIGNFVIGLAGAIFAMMQNFIAPSNFTFSDSLIMLSIIVLGGLGNLWAILPAAILVVVMPEKLQEIGEFRILVFAVLVVLVLRFRPSGLFPRALRKFRREVAQ
ncbi:branched-chain amino acid ABC transporter permease [Aminobacter aganoensis]|uniref:ABC-type branched-subunit amino acid transport system permease subunit n=1 Tax=Aminobacter aganoensis TaxID=83264 RepID=A0A7X0FDQ9_9HYPH|nr:branched-chain amino acid ABC transporter permease [Aminobacter aganoensis]MBB6357821.1 ABC-type branched-subunit amino acid transport system permease subunit [Aminobacter aganoensis]